MSRVLKLVALCLQGHAGVSAVEGYYSAATSRLYCRFTHEAKLIANAGNDFVKDLSPGTQYYLLAAACSNLKGVFYKQYV